MPALGCDQVYAPARAAAIHPPVGQGWTAMTDANAEPNATEQQGGGDADARPNGSATRSHARSTFR